jgi:hypothetical protein
MPKKRGVRIVVLVEDASLEAFSRKVLLKMGFSRHEVDVRDYPVGKNAKQWVSQQYPTEVSLYRKKKHSQEVAMLVGTEADELTVQQRHNALADALRDSAQNPRANDERVVLWIPKWHIETWIYRLQDENRGENVVENESYKHKVGNPDFASVAQRFVELYHLYKQVKHTEALPSLNAAFQETTRLGV